MLIQEQRGEFGSAKMAGRKLLGGGKMSIIVSNLGIQLNSALWTCSKNSYSRFDVLLRKLEVSGLERLGVFFRLDEYVIMCLHGCTQNTHIVCTHRLYSHIASVGLCQSHLCTSCPQTNACHWHFYTFFVSNMWKSRHRWLVLRVLHLFIYSFSVEHLREMKTKQVCLFGMPVALTTLRGLSWDNRFL